MHTRPKWFSLGCIWDVPNVHKSLIISLSFTSYTEIFCDAIEIHHPIKSGELANYLQPELYFFSFKNHLEHKIKLSKISSQCV